MGKLAVFFFVLSAAFAAWAAWLAPAERKRREAVAASAPKAAAPSHKEKFGPLNVIELSNHASKKAAQASLQREAEYDAAVRVYRETLQARQTHLSATKTAFLEAWRSKKPAQLITAAWGLLTAHRTHKPTVPMFRPPSRDEVLWRTGQEGENALSAYLEQLDGRWTLIGGYKNSKGEIDRILVGPRGVFAFEVKHRNGVIYCDGDRWWLDKYDNYGNLVEEGVSIADRGGRGPSLQLNEPADKLEAFLAVRGLPARLYRVVVFTHEKASFGRMDNIKVDFVATLGALDLERIFTRVDVTLNQEQCRKVVGLIEKDHGFHAKPRRTRHIAVAATGI